MGDVPCPNLTNEALIRLATEVIARAVKDALGISAAQPGKIRGDLTDEALCFLWSEDGALYAEAAGYDHEKIMAWVDDGCPGGEEIKARWKRGQGAKGRRRTDSRAMLSR